MTCTALILRTVKKSDGAVAGYDEMQLTGIEGWTAHHEFGCFSLFAVLTPASSQPPREPTTTTPFVLLNALSLGIF